MSRFGPLYASFYARDNLSTPLADTQAIPVNYRIPLSARGRWVKNGAGEGEALLPLDAYLPSICYAGVVCTIYQYDAVSTLDIAITPAFIVENVEPIADPTGDRVRISGPGLVDELKFIPVFEPVASVTTTNSTISAAVPGPSSTTIRTGQAAAANTKRIYVTSLSDFAEGDQVTITLDDTSSFVTLVETLEPAGEDYALDLRDRLPDSAAAGNTVARKARKIPVASNTEAFQVGVEVYISDPDDPETLLFFSIVEEAPGNDLVTLRDAVTLALESGWEISAQSRATPTTSDVTQIMAQATSGALLPGAWSISFETGTGTANGTHHAPSGDSIYELLAATAEQTSEFFRPHNYAGGLPARTLVWRRTADNSNVRLVNPTQDKIDDSTAGYVDSSTGLPRVDRGWISGKLERKGVWALVTRVYPFAGDDRISITKAGAAAVSSVSARGYTIVNPSGAWGSLYTKPYLVSASRETTYDVLARTETWSDIKVKTDNAIELVAASDQLLQRAASYLDERTGPRYTYEIDGIVTARPILPGQLVELVYTDPAGAWSISKTGGGALYCIEVENTVDEVTEDGDVMDGGYRKVKVILSDDKWGRPTPERSAARSIAGAGRTARDMGGASDRSGSGGSIILSGGGSPATISATTANATGALGHTHAALTTSNGRATPGEILKTSATGQAVLASLKTDYLYFMDDDGSMDGARGTVRMSRQIYDEVVYLVSEVIDL